MHQQSSKYVKRGFAKIHLNEIKVCTVICCKRSGKGDKKNRKEKI